MKTKLIIFGITGDLSTRKLLPVLTEIAQSGDCDPLSIIGVSRRDVDVAELIQSSTDSDVLKDRTSIYTMSLSEPSDYVGLKDYVNLQDDEQAVIYLSVPPSAATDIVDFLGQAGLNTPNVKIMFEKPFGFDYLSAQQMVERSARYFKESQIYRIDHYMAKEVAAEVLRLRSVAASKHQEWDNRSIEKVEITASETLGVEDRAAFYEQTGALRDIIQGHLMQLLSLVLLDSKGATDLDQLPQRRYEALAALKRVNPEQVIRAQYEGYDAEVENIGSTTETFARVRLESTDPRWEGVPLFLTSGKKLHEKRTAITIYYKDGTKESLVEGQVGPKDTRLPDAYERVLVEAIRGRKAIFTTSPELLQSWKILEPLQESWAMSNEEILKYPQGVRAEDIV
jgi:glucose-6-phosphate 1-dehydrogenase